MTEGVRELTPTEIEDLAAGAWILGAGGGGNPYHSLLTLRAEAARGFRPVVIPASALADDDLVAVVSTMGAPLVGEERLPDPDVAARPVQVLAERLGRPFVAVMSLEIGGANSLQSFMVAARTGLPVVDADCMGRAFPEAQMTTFAIAGLRNYPFCLADIRDNVVIVERAASWQWQERLGRVVVTEVGSIAATAKAPRTGREIKDHAILGSVTRAIGIGAALRHARERGEDPVDAVLASEGGIVLFTGKVSDMERRTTRGFLRGVATVAGLGEDRGSTMELHFQNEFAVAFRDGEPVGMTPDILTVVDSSTGEALGTEVITYGQRVRVIALASPAALQTEAALEGGAIRIMFTSILFPNIRRHKPADWEWHHRNKANGEDCRLNVFSATGGTACLRVRPRFQAALRVSESRPRFRNQVALRSNGCLDGAALQTSAHATPSAQPG